MAQCFAEWEAGGDAFDMSGNVKEWTAERSPGVNPIRGGSFNNTAVGTSCQFDFLTADDDFFLPNIGFRCCR
jgi:formylglycine-generating enzyme required for sulfatase activity